MGQRDLRDRGGRLPCEERIADPAQRGSGPRRPRRGCYGKRPRPDLYLTRELKSAKLVRVARSPLVTDALVTQEVGVAAGVKLQADAERVPGVCCATAASCSSSSRWACPPSRR